jgi:hypothetical protein
MSNEVVVVNTVLGPRNNLPTSAIKLSYLVYVEEGKKIKKFITLDKPEFLEGFVQAKGIFSELPDSEIINNYSQLLTTAPKELILEMFLPWHKIHSIRSLVFKAK